jgi:hypothetical protein
MAATCSLPCVRCHKQRAQCSGIRDPTAYLKRAQLGTAKAFDQDFNLISGLERKIENAGRDVSDRGLQLHGDQPASPGRTKAQDRLQRRLQGAGIVVEKAPIGMSRRVRNQTSWDAV